MICTRQLKGNKVLRIGFLHAGDHDDNPLPAGYELGDDGIVRITAAFSLDDNRSRWWPDSIRFGDDPDRTEYDYAPPSEMTYRDSEGVIGLVKCFKGSYQRSFGHGLGSGDILPRYAIEGPQRTSNYQKINGLRSGIDGLASWLGASAHSLQMQLSDQGRPIEATAKVGIVPDITLSQSMNLTAKITGSSTGPTSSEIVLRSKAFIQTVVEPACDWSDHLKIHISIRDLLRVAGWERLHFLSHQAYNLRESYPQKEGEPLPIWRDVTIAMADTGGQQWREQDDFLFRHPDISDDGIDRWLDLTQAYQRGLNPFISLLNLSGATIDAVIAQLGIALEAIGYQALVDSNLPGKKANKMYMRERIEHLIAEISDGVLSFNASNFGKDFAESYNSVKHANRPVIPQNVKQEHFWQGVELVRKWIGLRLGVSSETLKKQRW